MGLDLTMIDVGAAGDDGSGTPHRACWQAINRLLAAANHGDINYNTGDASLAGRLLVYSQIMSYGPSGSGGADLVLIAPIHRQGGADYDIHLASERVGGVNGTGVCFMDIDIKVADFLAGTPRGHGLRITQENNAPSIEFPISGGIIDLDARLRGRNGANKDLLLRIGNAAGLFGVENAAGIRKLTVKDDGSLEPGRVVDTVQGLASSTTPALDAALGNYYRCSISSNIAVVVQVPSNKPGGGSSQEITVEFINASGGALSTAPTFATGTDGFLVNGPAINPGVGLSVFYSFRWSSPRARWIELYRSAAL